MHYLLFYDVVDDYITRRVPLRSAHLDYAQPFVERGELTEQNVRLTMIGRRDGLPAHVLDAYERTAEQLSALSYHVRVLAECRAIVLVRTEQIRGSTQHFYRAAVKAGWAITALEAGEKPPRRGGSQGEEKG